MFVYIEADMPQKGAMYYLIKIDNRVMPKQIII